mgnify:CR=1 FL=1
MNISVNTYNISPSGYKPYDHFLRAGWTNVSIAYQTLEFDALAGDGWREYILSIKDELDRRGMRCVQTHLPYYDLLRDSGDSDAATDRVLERGLILTSMLGAKWGAFHCRTAMDGDNERSFSDNFALLSRLLTVAREYDVGIAVENLPDFYPGVPVHLFGTDHRDLIRLSDALNDPEHLGVCWDFGHAQMNHVDQTAALREVGSRLRATHIHGNSGFNDDHLPVALGTVNWDEMMRVLAEIGYEGSLSCEVLHPGDKVCGCSFEAPGFAASSELFADEYFAFNYRCMALLLQKFNEYSASV